MLVDLHAKSEFSDDCSLSARAVLERAKQAGLDAVAFVDRLATAHAPVLIEEGKRLDLPVFIGVEIPTDRGVLLCFVPEIGDFYLAEEWRELADMATPAASDVIDLILAHKGAVIAARPYDMDIPFNMGDLLFTLKNLHAVEVFTNRVGEIQHDFALEASSFLGVPTIGGSDSLTQLDVIGRYATFFSHDLATQADLVAALRESEFWAVQIGEKRAQRSTRTSDPFAKRRMRDEEVRDGEDAPRPRRDEDDRPRERRNDRRSGRGGDRRG
jgi:predicted metal-dependent phosphoesterase TrpH